MCLTGGIFPAKTGQTRQFQIVIIFPQSLFGDVKGTQDAILIIHSKDWQTIEILIARGQRNNKRNLYHLLCDKELDLEIEALRSHAKS